ncbi:MAG: Bax inhibitor-1/YccA family protein [Candidatus Gastranaerophilales bacterium]|nr:Bax inhibitor-1/YccA family protein [Candidatus Gastranaerophilales bacterium]
MSGNPLTRIDITERVALDDKVMSASGAVNKTLLLLAIVVLVGYYTWSLCATGFTDKAGILSIGGFVCSLILAIITMRNPSASHITAPAYAAFQGLLLGSISFSYSGFVYNAIGITLLVLFSMLCLYNFDVIKATNTFKKVIFTATLAAAIFYFAIIIASFLNFPVILFDGSKAGIILSLVLCAIAAFNFVVDFDFIEQGEEQALPAYYEWYGAFMLLVTLLWLYLEVLRFLASFYGRE